MRRFFICFLCICLLTGSVTIAADMGNTDDVNADAHISYELMKHLQVIDGSEDYTKPVSRREFAETLAKVLNIEAGTYTYNYYYTDVEQSSVINDLTARGYFYGNGKYFLPEDEISIYDACLVALRVLGYQPYLNAINADNSQIMLTAMRAGLIYEIPENSKLDFGTMLAVFNNMLLTEQVMANTISDKYHTFSAGECLLTEIYDLYYDEGTIIANSITALYENLNPTTPGTIRVDGTVYEYECRDEWEKLGKRINFYYEKKDGSLPKIVCTFDDSEDEINLLWKDVASYSNNVIRYYQNGRVRTLTLTDAAVVYNGIAYFDFTQQEIEAKLKAARTRVRINKDVEGGYSYLFINNYRNGEVQSVDDEGKNLYVKFPEENKILSLDELIADKKCIIIKMSDGTYIDFSQLKKGDFISACISEDDTAVCIYVCDKSVIGTVKAVSGDDTVTIGETQYEVDSDYMAEKGIEPGEQGTYFLDCFGNIAFKAPERSYTATLGYIYGTHTETVFEEEISYKIYDENGNHKIYKLADKVILDGTRTDKSTAHAKLVSYDVFDKHLIGFKTNLNNEITWIDTAYDTSDGDNTLHMQKAMTLMEFEKDNNTGGYQFYKERTSDLSAMEVCYPVSTGAKVIAAPSDAAHKEEYAFKNYSATTTFVSGTEYYAEFYNFDSETPFVEFILQKADAITYIDDETSCYMVADVLKSLSSVTETAVSELSLLYCSGYQSTISYARVNMQVAPSVMVRVGEESRKQVDGLSISEIISEGDIIQLVKSGDGLVYDIRLLFDCDEEMPYWGNSYESMSYADYSEDKEAERYIYGTIDQLHISSLETTDHYVIALSDANNPGTVKDMCAVQGNYYRYPIYDSSRRETKAYVGYLDDLNGAQNTGKNSEASKAFVKMGKNTTAITSIFFYK